MSFRHLAHISIIFAGCASILIEFALTNQNHQCQLTERHVTHSSERTPIFTFHMLAAQTSRLINQFKFSFGLTSDRQRNESHLAN